MSEDSFDPRLKRMIELMYEGAAEGKKLPLPHPSKIEKLYDPLLSHEELNEVVKREIFPSSPVVYTPKTFGIGIKIPEDELFQPIEGEVEMDFGEPFGKVKMRLPLSGGHDEEEFEEEEAEGWADVLEEPDDEQ